MTAAFIEQTGGVRVVRIDGHASDDEFADLRRQIGEARHVPTILDLSDLVLGGTSVASVVDELVDACGAACIIVRRATAGLLLERLGIARRLPIFGSVGDALQALRMQAEGYGSGWTPLTPLAPDSHGIANGQRAHTDHRGRLGNGSREPGRPVVTAVPEAAGMTATAS